MIGVRRQRHRESPALGQLFRPAPGSPLNASGLSFCRPISVSKVQDHSHSIINNPPNPAWLKGLAMIEKGLYRRFYRQENTPFAGAGFGTIGGVPTYHQSLGMIPNEWRNVRRFCTVCSKE
jgi:hypothetical protein